MQLTLESHSAADAEARAAATAEVRRLVCFFGQIGLPVTLGQLGITDAAAVAVIALRAVQTDETIHNMPFPVTADSVAAAIVAADALGHSATGS